MAVLPLSTSPSPTTNTRSSSGGEEPARELEQVDATTASVCRAPADGHQSLPHLIGRPLVRPLNIVLNGRLNGALTLSFPGAAVTDIAEKITSVLDCQLQVNRVVIHVGE